MKRAAIGALLGCLLLGTLGCCNPCCQRGCKSHMGCGKPYISDWYEGLGCDPCDDCGHWTGGCNGHMKPWLQHWKHGCGGWYFPGLYGHAYGTRCQRCCGGNGPCCGDDGHYEDDGYYHGEGGYDGATQQGEVIYDGPVKDKPTVAPDSNNNLIPPPSTSSQQSERQWRSLKTSR